MLTKEQDYLAEMCTPFYGEGNYEEDYEEEFADRLFLEDEELPFE